jgi:hypothetical protein
MKKLFTLAFALVFSTGLAFGQSNMATIDQMGDDHDASIDQVGQFNEAYVDQTDGGGGSTGNAVATVDQEGNANLVNLRQVSFYGQLHGDSEASITQIGDNNKVHGQSVEDAFLQSNVGGLVDVYMEGNNNTLYSLRDEAQKNGNSFELEILGDDNMVGMMQEFGVADVDIIGSSNDVTVSQLDGGIGWQGSRNQATVNINGSNNKAAVTQQ